MTYLNGIFHSHGKTEEVFFLTTSDVLCVHHFFSFPVAVNNSINVGPFVFLL